LPEPGSPATIPLVQHDLDVTGGRALSPGQRGAYSIPRTWSTVRAILFGTLAVGVIDGLDALIFSGFRGVSPMRLFQGIAFSLLGRETFSYGLASALLGVLLHFCVAFGIVTVYVLVSRFVPPLRQYPFVFGPPFGIVAWLVMNFVVLPMTAIGSPRLAWPNVINGILIHMFGVGLPAAIAASMIRRPISTSFVRDRATPQA
jgi:hypothetical protein